MNFLNQIKARLAALFRKHELDADMDEEMRSHIELRTQANIEAGMNPEEARFSALRQFGWTESIKEDCREQRGVTWLENLAQDIRSGARQRRKNSSFTAVAALMRALEKANSDQLPKKKAFSPVPGRTSCLLIRPARIAAVAALAAVVVAGTGCVHLQRPMLDHSSRVWVQTVLDAWTTVSRLHLHISPTPVPWIVFYDEHRAWHLNADVALLPATHTSATPISDRSGGRHSLHVVPNADGLWLPGSSPVLLNERQPRVFTMPYAGGTRAFSVVPLPAWFRSQGDTGTITDPAAFFVGVAIHEIVHTRHLPDVMRRISALRERHSIPAGITENILQQTYATNAAYVALYQQERDALFQAAGELDAGPDSALRHVARALTHADARRAKFFTGDRAVLADLEDLFLVLEGVGVWAQFQVLRSQATVDETWQTTAMNLLRLNTDWVQEEGFALFVLMDRLVPDWQARFFDPEFPSPFAVLRETVKQHGAK